MQTNQNKKYKVYGAIGIFLVFLMGGIVGFIMNGSDRVNNSTMSKYDCNRIAERIMNAASNNNADLVAQLDKIYSENCLNRVFDEPKPEPKKEEIKKLPQENCAAIEELLKQNLNDENSTDPWAHEHNVEIYQRMLDQGCPKNKEKHMKMIQREAEIVKALDVDGDIEISKMENYKPTKTCEKIEYELLRQTNCRFRQSCDSYTHLQDAKIYANLSERGCPENSEKYKKLAAQELEIARALNDDNMQDEQDSIEIVETYKRLQMQQEAARMIEKAKKLTNPAIDFIIQLEKIIEE